MGKSKILIVDDIAENRKILATILSKNPNYELSLASNGAAVLQTVEEISPDLILLDIMMPGMDGFELMQKLQSIETVQNTPVIFITALADIDSKVLAFNKGGVDYITKPFNKEELIARVSTHLQLKHLQDDLREKNKLLEDRELHLEISTRKNTET